MKHRKYERYLHLNRTGELQPAEQVELAEHLKSCADCAECAEEMEALEQTLGTVRVFSSELPAASTVTVRIMDAIRTLESERSVGYILDRFLDRFFMPRIPRIAYSMVCVLLIGLFSVQSLDTLILIHGLEQRLASGSQSLGTAGGQIIIQHEELPGLLTSLDATILEQGAALGMRVREGRIYVRSSLFKRWGQQLHSGDRNRILRLYGLRQQSPSQRKLQEFITNINFRSWGRAITLRPGR